MVLRSMPAPGCGAGALGERWRQEPVFQSARLESLKVSLMLSSWIFLAMRVSEIGSVNQE